MGVHRYEAPSCLLLLSPFGTRCSLRLPQSPGIVGKVEEGSMRVVVNSLRKPVSLLLSMGGRHQCCRLSAGGRLLLSADVGVIQGVSSVLPLDTNALSRMLAHVDHVRGIVRVGGAVRPLVVEVDASVEDEAKAERWLIGRIARWGSNEVDEHLELLAQHLARKESYGLTRFILEEGAEGSISELAQRYGLSVAQFYRSCRRVLGGPLKRELRTMRAARALLDYTGESKTFTRLAADHGYASPSHFCTEIKALLGLSPMSVYKAVAPLTE